jgi:pyruvate dehydrogenase E1 component beta subunit
MDSNKDFIKRWLTDYLNSNEDSFLFCEGIKDGFYGTIPEIGQIQDIDKLVELPISEAASVGLVTGASIFEIKPIICFQRVEFALLALDQLVTNSSKLNFLTNKKLSVSFLLRLVVGRGWGQGPCHSQSFETLWNIIPGLKVFMPANSADYLECFEYFSNSSEPIICLEHRWTHLADHSTELGLINKKSEATIYSYSYNSFYTTWIVKKLAKEGIFIDVIHENCLFSKESELIKSVQKTKKLLTCDLSFSKLGISSEIICSCVKNNVFFEVPPVRISCPFTFAPARPEEAFKYFPNAHSIINGLIELLPKRTEVLKQLLEEVETNYQNTPSDIPSSSFKGPF